MTLPKLSSLSLDAKRVMCAEQRGWADIHFTRVEWFGIKPIDSRPRIIPNYPVDPVAALTLCDAMAEKGWTFDATIGPDGIWDVAFQDNSTRPRDSYPAPQYVSLAAAITDAFLLANKLAEL